MSGVIEELYCDYNAEVKKGQVCAKIDPHPYQSGVNEAKANLAVASALLEKDKASLAYLRIGLRACGNSDQDRCDIEGRFRQCEKRL